jgi:hypothetical protein
LQNIVKIKPVVYVLYLKKVTGFNKISKKFSKYNFLKYSDLRDPFVNNNICDYILKYACSVRIRRIG